MIWVLDVILVAADLWLIAALIVSR